MSCRIQIINSRIFTLELPSAARVGICMRPEWADLVVRSLMGSGFMKALGLEPQWPLVCSRSIKPRAFVPGLLGQTDTITADAPRDCGAIYSTPLSSYQIPFFGAPCLGLRSHNPSVGYP